MAAGRPSASIPPVPIGCAAAQASHELRTPANALLGHLELLLGGAFGPLGGELRRALGEAQQAGLTLLRAIEAHLDQAADGAEPVDLLALLRTAGAVPAVRRGRAPSTAEPRMPSAGPVLAARGRLVVLGDPGWLAELAGSLVALGRRAARDGAPARLEVAADRATGDRILSLVWPPGSTFRPAARLRLVEAVLALHGRRLAVRPDRLALRWPAARLGALPSAAGSPRRRTPKVNKFEGLRVVP